MNIDQIRKRHAKRRKINEALGSRQESDDVGDLLEEMKQMEARLTVTIIERDHARLVVYELDELRARLMSAEAVCDEMLKFVPSLFEGYQQSGFKKNFVDPWEKFREETQNHPQ